MPVKFYKYCFVFSVFLVLAHCRKPYLPPAITAANNYLVVDGVINTTPNSVTSINLNRTRNLNDTTPGGIPELHAQIIVVSSGGPSFSLLDTANTGIYNSVPMTLDNNLKYGIQITTSDGKKYASDMVISKQTPAIDSFYWQQPNDFTLYISAHDATNNTRYYRWDYTETWEHDAQLQTPWGVSNNVIFPVDSTNQTFKCYTVLRSPNILLASTQALASDIVDRFPLETIPSGDAKLALEYSMLVRQYALTEDAYNYWLLIQKTSSNLGSLFDLQPSQLIGNIHGVTDPNTPVIGYISASSIQQQRIFVYDADLNSWNKNALVYTCDTMDIPVNVSDYRLYNYPDTLLAPYYFITNGPLVLASKTCLDCLLFGGTNVKPSYWQ